MLQQHPGVAQVPESGWLITGFIHDKQGTAVQGAQVNLLANGVAAPLAQAVTQADGRFTLVLTEEPASELSITVAREHFKEVDLTLEAPALQTLRSSGSLSLPEITLLRRVSLSFWIATLVFIGMLGGFTTFSSFGNDTFTEFPGTSEIVIDCGHPHKTGEFPLGGNVEFFQQFFVPF